MELVVSGWEFDDDGGEEETTIPGSSAVAVSSMSKRFLIMPRMSRVSRIQLSSGGSSERSDPERRVGRGQHSYDYEHRM